MTARVHGPEDNEAVADHLSRALDSSGRRLQELRLGSAGAADGGVAQQAIAGLATAIEELRIGGEVLRAQNRELVATLSELAEERQRFRDLFEQAPDAYVVTDEDGVISAVNSAAATLFAVPARQLPGKPLELYLPGAATRIHRLQQLRASSSSPGKITHRDPEWETILRPRRSPEVHVGVSLAAVHASDGAAVRWLMRDLSHRRRNEEMRRGMLREMAAAEEQERLRLSRELHDQLGQTVTALQLGLKALERTPDAAPPLQALQQLADRISRDLRDVAAALRPPALDRLGLRGALQSLVSEWSDHHPVAVAFETVRMGDERFDPATEATLFRMLQEALTNVARHAAATNVSVVLERRTDAVALIIEDDGRGLDPAIVERDAVIGNRFGLRGMRERLSLIGGTLEIESEPGAGSTLYARVPVPRPGSLESGEPAV